MNRVIILSALLAVSAAASADEFVNGYMRGDGTYVQPHFRSSPNSTSFDNYSTRGNVNPYTGSRGYTSPYGSGAFGSPSGSLFESGEFDDND